MKKSSRNGKLVNVNRLIYLTNGTNNYLVNKVPEICKKGLYFECEIQDDALLFTKVARSDPKHPKNRGRKARNMIHPTTSNKNGWLVHFPVEMLTYLGWTIEKVSLSMECLASGKKYLVRKSTEHEREIYGHREPHVESGFIDWNLFGCPMCFTLEERKHLGIKRNDILQCELNLRNANYIKLRVLREGEEPYPNLNAAKRNNPPVLSKYDVNFCFSFKWKNYQFPIPAQFRRSNNLQHGDRLTVTAGENKELILECAPQICSVCGESHRGLETVLRKGHICSKCAKEMENVQDAISAYGSIEKAVSGVGEKLSIDLEVLERKLNAAVKNAL